MTASTGLAIKGTRDGLQVTLGTGEWDDVLVDLRARLAEQGRFFEGARVIVQAGGRALSIQEITGVQAVLAQHNMVLWAVLSESEETRSVARGLGLATRLSAARAEGGASGGPPSTVPAFMRDTRETPAPVVNLAPAVPAEEPGPTPVVIEDGVPGLLIRRTLRSGKSVRYSGAVIVLGDLNPGAEIIAGGDVVVWGKLRGVVHAGAMGDEQAVVCALDMAPTQLRIAGRIAMAPSDDARRRKGVTPEMARVRENRIVVEGWAR